MQKSRISMQINLPEDFENRLKSKKIFKIDAGTILRKSFAEVHK
jgi:hypothetical protein